MDAAADTDPLSKVLGASRAIHNVQHLAEVFVKISLRVSRCLKKELRDLRHIEEKASQIPRQIIVLSAHCIEVTV